MAAGMASGGTLPAATATAAKGLLAAEGPTVRANPPPGPEPSPSPGSEPPPGIKGAAHPVWFDSAVCTLFLGSLKYATTRPLSSGQRSYWWTREATIVRLPFCNFITGSVTCSAVACNPFMLLGSFLQCSFQQTLWNTNPSSFDGTNMSASNCSRRMTWDAVARDGAGRDLFGRIRLCGGMSLRKATDPIVDALVKGRSTQVDDGGSAEPRDCAHHCMQVLDDCSDGACRDARADDWHLCGDLAVPLVDLIDD
mmetsp:Transcript_61904/g.137941  ORF Transcript_61904/g.137941 Transcript_61904/m.137941 type:complete len:253 (+) Transcript_61904:578-1336(+)